MALAEILVGDMFREALERSDTPVKSLAKESNYSVDAVYAAIKGKRKLPKDAKEVIAKIHPLGGLAVAYQETGYRCFTILQGDQHPQNILQKALKEDDDVDKALDGLEWRLIDKKTPEDLTEEDKLILEIATKEIIEEIRALLSLLIIWEDTYGIEVVNMLLETVGGES